MGLEFLDLDREIEKEAGMTITGIFEQDGEDQFRKIEREMLKQLIRSDNFVLATGGGTPCYRDNIDLMNKAGQTLLLDVHEDELFLRLKNSKQQRPLIANKEPEELKHYIRAKLKERASCYNKSQIKIDPLNTSLELIKQILSAG